MFDGNSGSGLRETQQITSSTFDRTVLGTASGSRKSFVVEDSGAALQRKQSFCRRQRATANRPSSTNMASCSAAVTASGKPPLEVLARAAAQLASVDELALELEVPINADDQQLLEVALSLDHYVVAGLFG